MSAYAAMLIRSPKGVFILSMRKMNTNKMLLEIYQGSKNETEVVLDSKIYRA